jgi:hypothetical protein
MKKLPAKYNTVVFPTVLLALPIVRKLIALFVDPPGRD